MTPAQALDHAADAATAAAAKGESVAQIDATLLVLAIIALANGECPRSAPASLCTFIEHASVPALKIDAIVVTTV